MKNNTPVDKNSREYRLRKLAAARSSLIVVIAFTVINLILLLTESNTYFLFSASVPYFLTAFGMGMDIGLGNPGIGVYTTTALVISAVIVAAYLLCWILSKKRSGWFVVAAVLFIIDTVLLVLVSLGLDALGENIVNLIFHAWVLVELFQAIAAAKKLKNMPAEPVVADAAQTVPAWQPAPVPEEPWNQPDKE